MPFGTAQEASTPSALEPQVPVQGAGVMLLDDEARLGRAFGGRARSCSGARRFGGRLRGRGEVAFGFVLREVALARHAASP